MTMRVPAEVCRDHARSSRLEWLETNGAGGFAMGTVAGTNTRGYHGLLVASLRPPVDRTVLLSRLDETYAGVELAANQYPGAVSPQGYKALLEFRIDPYPTWVYEVDGARLEKQLYLVQGEQTVVVTYRSTQPRHLSIAPFVAFRDYHSLSHANPDLDDTLREQDNTLRIRPYARLPELTIRATPGATIERNGCWYYNTEYLVELERGLDYREDLWKPCTLHFEIGPDKPVTIIAGVAPVNTDPPAPKTELQRAADQFIVRRADGKPTIIAGYPWFTDWGRDTMISLPGLLISRGRRDEAREVLRGFLAYLDRGLIPNAFPDHPEDKLEYNTVDATLWMFQAVHALGDERFLREEFLPRAREIIRWHRLGTHHGIRVDPADHLLSAGAPGVALTWMDARVDGHVITPRQGKPVEINALWYNALRLMAQWGEPGYAHEADLVALSFERAFWNPELGCLRDVHDDDAIRPNQLFALSLPYPLLTLEQRKSVVKVVQEKLLTPYGLRTLAPDEPGYVPHYRGDRFQRDNAYHQGTVWPWLFGPFVRAYLCAFGRSPETIALCRALLEPLQRHLNAACLGTISEVFDAEPPYAPGGAPAQAWSVAEFLQLLNVDLALSRP
jgi:glycogen debranching enzyme